MKSTKIISITLAICVLLSATTFLQGCKKKPEEHPTNNSATTEPAEHPEGEKPADHPEGAEHPNGEHPK